MDKACSTAPAPDALILTPPVVDVSFDVDDVVVLLIRLILVALVLMLLTLLMLTMLKQRAAGGAECALILTPLGRNFGHQVATPPFL